MENTSRTLQLLYSLDTSSPDFLSNLRLLIQHDEEERYLIKLKEPELTRLVDFLDKVRTAPSTFRRFQGRLLQAFDVIPTNDDLARECFKKLHAICANRRAFPSSHILSGELESPEPLFRNRFGYYYRRGTYRGEEVDIIDMMHGWGKKQVCAQYCMSSQRLLMDILGCCRGSPI